MWVSSSIVFRPQNDTSNLEEPIGAMAQNTRINHFEFLLAEGEIVFDVVGLLRVVGAFTVGDVEDVEFVGVEADLRIELEAFGEPFIEE